MPPAGALKEIPTVADPPTGEGDSMTTQPEGSTAAMIANLLQGGLPSKGVYVEDGLPPVQPRVR